MKPLRVVHRLALLALVWICAGCGDSPSGPDPALNVLRIQLASLSFEERTIGIGEEIQLTGQLYDATDTRVAGTGVDWRSTDPSVATVTSLGKVRGVAVGSTWIIASAGAHEDTARVNVALPVGTTLECAEDAGLLLSVGEVRTVTGDEAASLCLRSGPAAAEYTLIPFNGSESAAATLPVEIVGSGISASVTGPPTPNRVPAVSLTPTLRRNDEFHMRMLRRSAAALEPRLRSAVRRGMGPDAPRLAVAPVVGGLVELNVEVDSGSGCSNPDRRGGRVVAVTDRAIVVVDTANPRTGLSASAETDLYRSFGIAFDTLIWPIDTRNFGEPTDIDKNGHVLIFFTRAVNEQTPPENLDSFVGGYFYNRDLFATTGAKACAGSNFAEMFYLLAPDPTGQVNGHARSIGFIRNSTVGVLAHEFQHLINDSRRLYVNQSLVWEESWLNEGLSHIAEELAFYQSAGLEPRQNIGPPALYSAAAASAYSEFQAPNVDRYVRFLKEPEKNTLMGTDELATRGAIWTFLRYAADRDGGSETALWNRLVMNTKSAGLTNLQNALGANPRDWMADWATSVYTDDAGLKLDDAERFEQPSWNFRTLIPTRRTNQAPIGVFPLRTLPLKSDEPQTLVLSGGSTAYLRFSVPAGAQAALRATVRGLPAPSLLRVTIVRTK